MSEQELSLPPTFNMEKRNRKRTLDICTTKQNSSVPEAPITGRANDVDAIKDKRQLFTSLTNMKIERTKVDYNDKNDVKPNRGIHALYVL